MGFNQKFKTAKELEIAIKNVNYNPGRLLRFLRKAYWTFFVYYFRPNHVETVLTRTGLLHYESKDRTGGRILQVYRHFDFGQIVEVKVILQKMGVLKNLPDGTVLDVGGFLGMSSISFLHEKIFSNAISFEPNPASFELLKRNVKDNFLDDKITYYNAALSDKSGTLDFELSNKNYGDHRVRDKNNVQEELMGETERNVIAIQSLTFDDFVAKEPQVNTQDIKLIWMDVQGHEGCFLKGARNYILSNPHVPTIMEFWPYAISRSGMSKLDFVNIVQELYTHLFRMTDDGVEEYDMQDLGNIFDEHMDPNYWWTIMLINKTEGINI